MGLFFVSLGAFLGFFAFTSVGRATAKETAKYARGRLPPAEKWPGFRMRGPTPVATKPGVDKMPQEAVVYPGLAQFTAKMFACLPEEMRGQNFGAYYAEENLQAQLMAAANRCIEMRDIKSDLPTKFGEVGYVFNTKPNPLETEIRFVTQGYPRRGQIYKMLLKGWADWISNPGSLPMVSVERS